MKPPFRLFPALALLLLAALGLRAADPPTPAQIDRLVAQLGADEFKDREEAMKRLEAIGEPALPALRKAAADSDNLEVRRRAEELLGRIRRAAFAERHLWKGFKDIVWAVAISPDGRHVLAGGGGDQIDGQWVAGSDYAVRLYDAESGKELKRFPGNAGAVNKIAWSADGRRAYWNSVDMIRAWDMAAGKELEPFKDAGSVVAVSLSADGKRLLSGGWDRTVRLWDVEGRKELKRFEGHAGRVWDVALSPDGMRASSGIIVLARPGAFHAPGLGGPA